MRNQNSCRTEQQRECCLHAGFVRLPGQGILRKAVSAAYRRVSRIRLIRMGLYIYAKFMTWINLRKNSKKPVRALEIGPGDNRIPGYETFNIVPGSQVDYIGDAAHRLPFRDNTFDTIYASHVLEHIPWYQTVIVLKEWVRVLKTGGVIELWVPDALKICETLVEYEKSGVDLTGRDGWYRMNEERDPCKWASGRLFTYGDGAGATNHWNWHRAAFTPRYLKRVLEECGCESIVALEPMDVRGDDHGWISLGMKGTKYALQKSE